MNTRKDLDKFLTDVDRISELVNNLTSPDEDLQQKAMEDAERHIARLDEPCRTKVNQTRINSSAEAPRPHDDSPESFMKFVEMDADDRRRKRMQKEKLAVAFKDKGNEAFAREDYEAAVKLYSDGLAELRDLQPLYTNRAQAYMKLGRYEEAISDCKWALKCNERCIKAYLHMGKAYQALKRYKKSRNCFEKILEIEPGREQMMKEYLANLELEEKRESEEAAARRELERGEEKAAMVPRLLETLSVGEQTALCCSGRLQLLLPALTDCTGQTLFRLNNGFSIISGNETMRSCLLQEAEDPQSRDLCVCVLKLWRIVCCGNEENQKTLLTCPVSARAVLLATSSRHAAAREEGLALLRLYSQTPHGRQVAMHNLSASMLARSLMACAAEPTQRRENTAADILANFAEEKRFCIQLRSALTDSVTEPFTATLRNISKSNQHVVPPLLSAVGSLARDHVIRHTLAHDPECWRCFLSAIERCVAGEHKEILFAVLGLIINLATIKSPCIQERASELCSCCLGLLKDPDDNIVTRATGVLSAVLPRSSEAVQQAVRGDVVSTMIRLLEGPGQAAVKYAIKTLAACTAVSHSARLELVNSDKKLSLLRGLLGAGCDEAASGNAALCLAHCLELKGIAGNLLGTDIVLLLLRHAAGDAKRTAVQQNAAIALGKLCRSEPRHVNKLRELHGLEILHSCMKLIT